MNKLYKLTLKSFIGPFIATFFVCLFLILMQFLWKYVDEMVGKGLDALIIAKLLFFASASFIPLALPLSLLLSSMMTFGNLAENQELMAFKSAGISLFRVMKPLIIIVVLIAIGAFFFSNIIIPKANLKFGSLLWDVRKQKPALDLKEGVFYDKIKGYVIRVKKKNVDQGTLKDILIYDHTGDKANNIVLRAKSGKMYTTKDKNYLILKLFDGQRYEDLEQGSSKDQYFPHMRMRFEEYTMRFDISGFKMNRTKEALFKHHFQMLNVNQLSLYIDTFQNDLHDNRKKMRDYLEPYFNYLRDSAFFQKPNAEASLDSTPFIANFAPQKRKKILERAEKLARSTKGVLNVHAPNVGGLKEKIAEYKMAWHKKFTLSFACIILFFIGAPLGAIIRKGGLGMPALVSIILFLVYHVLSITGEKLAEGHRLDPWLGIWLPVLVLFPVGIIFLFLANTDSSLFAKTTYIQILKKIQASLGFGRSMTDSRNAG